ncbi:hypothetical protein [Pseudoduganella armeniaca]|uniref:Uncharacterized protein n=1 Tax=Pseudoduganella armeniaca TaxID=2072590 RepID=A0A2R4C956_9BURK|nr:hypothetical protein [Pseudoduganella armeniaca]AVR96111.1 hypothetical protein C9I28_10565 [Pseudoduganella armeniaca]
MEDPRARRDLPGPDDLLEWFRKQKVALETVHFCVVKGDFMAWNVALALHDAGLHVSYVAAEDIGAFADTEGLSLRAGRLGADIVARYCAARRPAALVAPSPQQRMIDEIERRLAELEEMRDKEMASAEKAQTHGALKQVDEIMQHVAWLDGSIAQFRKSLAELVELRTDVPA